MVTGSCLRNPAGMPSAILRSKEFNALLYNLRRGLSVVEIMVVAAIAGMIMTGAFFMMGKTTRQFRKGTDMINNQVLMESIVERLRSDVRGLRRLCEDSCNENRLSFSAFSRGRLVNIVYEYDPDTQTLFRREGQINAHGDRAVSYDQETNFHGARRVVSFMFNPYPSVQEFRHLNVAMQLVSDDKEDMLSSRLSIICQFHSTSLEPRTSFGRQE